MKGIWASEMVATPEVEEARKSTVKRALELINEVYHRSNLELVTPKVARITAGAPSTSGEQRRRTTETVMLAIKSEQAPHPTSATHQAPERRGTRSVEAATFLLRPIIPLQRISARQLAS